jgi:hypothetical protein
MKKMLIAAAVAAPVMLTAACGSSHPAGTVTGTFPYCHTYQTHGGVVVYDNNHTPCVVSNAHGVGYVRPPMMVHPTRTVTVTPKAAPTTKKPGVIKRLFGKK